MPSFFFNYTDNWHSGPCLSISDWNEEEHSKLLDDCCDSQKVEIQETKNYTIYYCTYGIDYVELDEIGLFEKWNDAEQFAKEQYFLYTGDFPFIRSGDYDNNYNSKGSRKEFLIGPNTILKFNKKDDDLAREFLIISNGDKIGGYSLNPFAEWWRIQLIFFI